MEVMAAYGTQRCRRLSIQPELAVMQNNRSQFKRELKSRSLPRESLIKLSLSHSVREVVKCRQVGLLFRIKTSIGQVGLSLVMLREHS